MNSTILIIATLTSGLIAGLFYSWSISVTPGLSKVNDKNYLQAFQKMNRAIINPVFLVCFMGLVVLLPVLTYISFNSAQFAFVLSSSILYLLGVMFVTIAGNIPLNNKLEALKIESMNAEQRKLFRSGFETKWNRLNIIRTISSTLSFLLLIIASVNNL